MTFSQLWKINNYNYSTAKLHLRLGQQLHRNYNYTTSKTATATTIKTAALQLNYNHSINNVYYNYMSTTTTTITDINTALATNIHTCIQPALFMSLPGIETLRIT